MTNKGQSRTKGKRKNPVAVALAKLRAKKLTSARRIEIATAAAKARWKSTKAARPATGTRGNRRRA